MSSQRSYLIDNCKALLIFLVVFGHLLASAPRNGSDFWMVAYIAIYSFHMPCFLFLSGVFSRPNEASTAKSVIRLVVLFFLMTILVCLAQYASGDKFHFHLLAPVFSAWYLMTLITCRLLLPVLSRMRFALPILVLLCLLVPFDNRIDTFMSMARTFYFLPFFFAGYKLGIGGILRIRFTIGRKKWFVIIFAVACLAGTIAFCQAGLLPWMALQAKASYADVGFHPAWMGMPMRAYLILTAFACIASLLLLLPDKKTPVSHVGTYCLSAYVLQAAAYRLLDNTLTTISFDAFALGWIYILVAAAFCLITTLPPIHKAISYPGELAVRLLYREPSTSQTSPPTP